MKFFHVFFFTICCMRSISGQCPAVVSFKYNIKWPNTASFSKITSTPKCISENMTFVYRNCLDAAWAPEPDCYFIQPDTVPECPDGFTQTEDICYMVTDSSTFPPSCPYPDVLDFISYKDLVCLRNPIWIPVRRDMSNGIGFLKWIEPSLLYGKVFQEKYYFEGRIREKDCLLYYNSSYITAVSCDEEHTAVCAYPIFSKLQNAIYTNHNCFQYDFEITTKCITILDAYKLNYPQQLAEFPHLYQNNLRKYTVLDSCRINLSYNTSLDFFYWRNLDTKLNYTFWQRQPFPDEEAHVYLTPTGWVNGDAVDQGPLMQQEIEIPDPEITFIGSLYTSAPTTTVVYSDSIYYYITNPDSLQQSDYNTSIVHFMSNILERESTAIPVIDNTMEFVTTYPGQYWCEAFKLPDISTLKSVVYTKVSADPNSEYVVLLDILYSQNINPLSPDIFQAFDKSLLLRSQNYDECFIVKIQDLQEERNSLILNVHISVVNGNLDDTSLKCTFEQDLLAAYGTNITLIDFRSIVYCMEDQTQRDFTWPQTPIGEKVEYPSCFLQNGQIFARTCQGNSTDGAYWSPLQNCTIPPKSDITDSITCHTLDLVLGSIHQLNAFDLYKITTILDGCPLEIPHVVDAFMNTNESIIAEAEQKMLATTNLLTKFLQEYKAPLSNEGVISFLGENLMTVKLSNQSGVIITKKENKLYIDYLPFNFTLTDALKQSSFEKIILFTTDYQQWLNDNGFSVLLSFFSKRVLFQETLIVSKHVQNSVVGLQLQVSNPPLKDYSEAGVYVITPKQDTELEKCVKWVFGNDGWWSSSEPLQTNSILVVCNLTPIDGYYSMASAISAITDDLNELYQGNKTDILPEVDQISQKYPQYRAVDIYLTGKNLEKAAQSDKISRNRLDNLAEIVNNLQQIDPEILLDSQEQYGATDTILQSIDEILERYEYTGPVTIQKDDFFIFITKLKDSNFSGLVASGDKVQVFGKEMDILNATVDSALFFADGLKDQIGQFRPVITTFFASDVLFVAKPPKLYTTSGIFSVILPEIGTYSSPISIFYRNVVDSQCVYWHFNHPSFWEEDGAAKSQFNLTLCQFWHTTHFALLIDNSFDDNEVLELITKVNCSLSLAGLCGLLLTAALFRNWRQNIGNKILLHFSLAIVFQLIIFFLNDFSEKTPIACTTVGAMLHFTILSQFCWMFIIALLQYRRLVQVFGDHPKYLLLKCSMFGWVFPSVVVALVVLLGTYKGGSANLCYPVGLSLYLGIWFPIAVILGSNTFIFITIMMSISYNRSSRRFSGVSENIFHWRLGFLLFFLLGLTWAFGFLAELYFDVFSYIFCFLATLQGFVLFVFFVLLNTETRKLYLKVWRNIDFQRLSLTKRMSFSFNGK